MEDEICSNGAQAVTFLQLQCRRKENNSFVYNSTKNLFARVLNNQTFLMNNFKDEISYNVDQNEDC